MFGKVIQIGKNAYEVIEQIGIGVTSQVYLVGTTTQHRQIFHLLTRQSTNGKINNQTVALQPEADPNPDLQRLDQLIIQNQPIRQNIQTLNDHSSFSIEHGRQLKQSPREYYALKIIQIDEGSTHFGRDKAYENEIRIITSLSHPGIIRILEQRTVQGLNKKQLLILQELGTGGNLSKFMDYISGSNFNDRQRQILYKYYIAQIIQIVDYLQRKGISHLDLKAQNFILDQHCRLKLIDFGVAEFFINSHEAQQNLIFSLSEQKNSHTYIGTLQYISPEMIERTRSRKGSRRSYYSKSDIWSIGVLIYFILTSRYPFSGINTYKTLQNIQKKQPKIGKIKNQHLRRLLEKMLVKNPAQRIGIKEVKESQYFEGVDFANIFTDQSPIVKMQQQKVKGEVSQILFQEQGLVIINSKTRRRIIGLSKKWGGEKLLQKQSILEKNNSFVNIDIKKITSQQTEFHSENKIQSQSSLKPPPSYKYLTISRIALTIPPQNFQILPSTSIFAQKNNANKSICRIKWGKSSKKSEYVDYPQQFLIKFQQEETLKRFLQNFTKIREDHQGI